MAVCDNVATSRSALLQHNDMYRESTMSVCHKVAMARLAIFQSNMPNAININNAKSLSENKTNNTTYDMM